MSDALFEALVQVDEGVLATAAPLAVDAFARVLGLVRSASWRACLAVRDALTLLTTVDCRRSRRCAMRRVRASRWTSCARSSWRKSAELLTRFEAVTGTDLLACMQDGRLGARDGAHAGAAQERTPRADVLQEQHGRRCVTLHASRVATDGFGLTEWCGQC